ncbi:MAG TPA: sigma-54 dependent transcriptional regulator [Polyangiaceae bacterium]|nr:sigma-54 dependent transcriptional regulator [Polyangiaceae bacterium]
MTTNQAACVSYTGLVEVPRAHARVVASADSGHWFETGYPASPSSPPPAASDSTPPPPPSLRVPRKVASVSPAMRHVFDLLDPLARAEVTITLTGETGTGKDVLARTIHERSARQGGPFVVFDCGAVAQNLAESELLGHERGAFTGAVSAHRGAFERADGGTLFLDELGELPLDLQTRLLRVLSNSSLRRVGGTKDLPVDVRVIAATNRDLRAEVAAGRFRQDLYFRLATAVVQVPPLRARLEDIPLLVERLLEDLDRPGIQLSQDALALLVSKSWPGNVRELKNNLAFALAFLDGSVLEARHLSMSSAPEAKADLAHLPLGGLKLESIERVAIEQTLAQARGNKSRAAQILGIAPSTLYEKLKKYQQTEEA